MLSRTEIQKIADEVANESKKSLNPQSICVIVADPKTGKILAMKGDGTRFLTQPVSTFKPMVMVAALEKGKISPQTKIDCESGSFKIGDFTLKDALPLGELDCEGILAKSSNIGIAKIAMLLEDQEFYENARRFGFGEKTGISIPGEIPGLLHPPSRWGNQTKVRMAIGQNLAVTPIQIAMAYGALANGGRLMRPALAGGKPQLAWRVCSPRTASIVRNALQSNSSNGGVSPLAQVNGVSVGGISGTARDITPEGQHAPGKTLTMFAGFFPADHPNYVIVVVVDQANLPESQNYGGLVAAPIFSEIAKKISLQSTNH
jgi:cell division protein FtsI/penicillin-binding protein 2